MVYSFSPAVPASMPYPAQEKPPCCGSPGKTDLPGDRHAERHAGKIAFLAHSPATWTEQSLQMALQVLHELLVSGSGPPFPDCVLTTGKRTSAGSIFRLLRPCSDITDLPPPSPSSAWLKWTTMSTNLRRDSGKPQNSRRRPSFPGTVHYGLFLRRPFLPAEPEESSPERPAPLYGSHGRIRHDCRGGPALPS